MKRCSTCNRTFTDPNLSFCIDDGTPLIAIPAQEEATVVSPSGKTTDGSRGSDNDWNAVAYRPPAAYVPPAGTNSRKVWPWVLGVVLVVVVGVFGLSIAAAVFLPRFVRSSQSDLGNSNARSDSESANRNSTQSNDNSADNGNNSHGDSAGDVITPPPTDKELVLAQLTDLENEWTVANLNADKAKLTRILADDYVGPTAEGRQQGKAEYIKTIQPDTSVQKWEMEGLELTLRGDRATLSGTVTFFVRDRKVVFDFTDKFVWRDSRWQASGSEVKPKE